MSSKKLANIRHFAVHYGMNTISELSQYDLIIVEPARLSREQIATCQSLNTLVVAYVSVMEVGAFHTRFWPHLRPEDFLKCDGRRIEQPGFDTFLVDLTSSHWLEMFYRHVGELLTEWKYDGIFLDTIGDVEMRSIPEQMTQLNAAEKIVVDLRRWFPDTLLIQNNGLEALCLKTAPYVNAIVWENPPLGVKKSSAWVHLIAQRLQTLRNVYDVSMMTLFDQAERLNRREWLLRRRFSDGHKFLAYFAPTHYLGSVRVEEPKHLTADSEEAD